jgi:hypothetical protein
MTAALTIESSPQQGDAVSKNLYENLLKVVTREWLYRGSSPSFAWIPVKSMRE